MAEATAEGITRVAEAGGKEAASLEVAKQYLTEFGKLAKENNTMIIPGNLTDMSAMVATAMSTFQHVKKGTDGTGAEPEIRLRS